MCIRDSLRQVLIFSRESLSTDPVDVQADAAADALTAAARFYGAPVTAHSPVDSPLVCVCIGDSEDWFAPAVVVRAAELVADGWEVAEAIEIAVRDTAH